METPMKRFMPRARKFAAAALATVAASIVLAVAPSTPAQAFIIPDEVIQEACGPSYSYVGSSYRAVQSSTGSTYGHLIIAEGGGFDVCVLVEKDRNHSGWGVSTHMETLYTYEGEQHHHGGDRVQYTMQTLSKNTSGCVHYGARIEHPTPGNWATATGSYCG